MVKVNGQEVEWKKFPEGWYFTDVQYHILWKNEDTGAMFLLIKIPKGDVHELGHTHPKADQMIFGLSGTMIRDGITVNVGEGNYMFGYSAKGVSHGPQKGSTREFATDCIALQYFNGPPTKLSEGETVELKLD